MDGRQRLELRIAGVLEAKADGIIPVIGLLVMASVVVLMFGFFSW